ncbi:beta-ketoacyl synthase N-terminal-like domain-containing protein [Spirulina sp. CCNP1310]|uniref:polyketide synthase n=1 Tax=Spirulina sp. CCNP1310 TaxID=3110249 RepID=UPI002B1F429A|nr:polyketide synthase [Spirulina sp. CCNP1310]MEA5417818.1 beta-ketoacyl synthase N-terminal-like domain-containing protein [Spirulina sp. CCNP1310]
MTQPNPEDAMLLRKANANAQQNLESMDDNPDAAMGSRIAIIGMAGRFPGANNIDELWQNVKNGVESITFFSDQELLAAGVSPQLLNDPNYVKASPTLPDLGKFDAFFFDYSAKEALYMDPQQRVFLECAWEALEQAGYAAGSSDYTIGIYGGSSISLYLLNNIIYDNHVYAGHMTSSRESAVFGGNVPESLTTRVAYKLNLTGPAVHLSTACSTSLVAVHSACQSLLNGECEIALAGGVSYLGSQTQGYLYEEGLVLSPDGHCRSFDAQGKGTLWANGVGLVVLKMLDEAIADGDTIHGVICGSAVNNDGNVKVSHSAPSVEGQARAIYQAQAVAEIDPETITYIEAHGTATALGDPIEIAALTQAFRAKTDQTGYCAVGSLKSNLGHLSEASGVAGLIKTLLALKHQQIPPSLYFETPNPQIDFESSPFYVNTRLRHWQSQEGNPRRAGVSSFGMGGTNAHVVVEEWRGDSPLERLRQQNHTPSPQLLLLSAKTSTALETATNNLITYLEAHPDLQLADVAYTLARGRKAFKHRRIAVVDGHTPIRDRFATQRTHRGEPKPRKIVFMCSGQGSQYVTMAQELYETEPLFQDCVDDCCEYLKPLLGLDLREILYPAPEQIALATEQLKQTALTQPALFVIEYAIAQLWISWGVQPAALIGHSVGEYVAATLAGVFSREDALTLVAKRGALMQSMPPGAMVAVPLPEHEVKPLLVGTPLEIATVNSPVNCVVSGPCEAIAAFAAQLTAQGIEGQVLQTSHAFHSAMMEPILQPFREAVRGVSLHRPKIPFVSNLTGTWITPEAAIDPDYYVQQLRSPVRFAAGVRAFFDDPDQILLEIGPGRTLSTLAKRHPDKPRDQLTCTSLRHPQETESDQAFLLKSLGELWLAGVEIDWTAYFGEEPPRRVPLPTYPFERQRYWLEPKPAPKTAIAYDGKKSDPAEWFYQPSWQRVNLPQQGRQPLPSPILAFVAADDLRQPLLESDAMVITVALGDAFQAHDPHTYTLNPAEPDDYRRLLQTLQDQDLTPQAILHLWNVTPQTAHPLSLESAETAQTLGFYSLLYLIQALDAHNLTQNLDLLVGASHLHSVTGSEAIAPEKATLIGAVRVIGHEYPNIRCRSVDVVPGSRGIQQILHELQHPCTATLIAYRGPSRWVETFEPTPLAPPNFDALPFRPHGVYLITGGMGGMGLVFAEYLAKTVQAKLILVGRSPLPDRPTWPAWLATHTDTDPTSLKIRTIQRLETWGATVLIVSADVANLDQMQGAIAQSQCGAIHGVIHTAGVAGGGVIPLKTKAIGDRVLAPKVAGTIILDQLIPEEDLDFRVLCSSLESVLGTAGQLDYCAANNFLDAYAQAKTAQGGPLTLSINWDAWQQVGMAVNTVKYGFNTKIREIKTLKHYLFEQCIVEEHREIYQGTLDPAVHWMIGEHVVLNLPSLVGTAYLELARSAYECHSGEATVELRDVYFLQFLFVEGDRKELRVILNVGDDPISFTIQTLDDDTNLWVEHAQGKIITTPNSEPTRYDLPALEAQCNQEMIVPDLQALPDYTHYGPRWLNNIQWRKASEDHNLALMQLPTEFIHDLEQYKFHPSMVDTATYVVADVLPNELTSKLSFFKEDSTYLPYFYERVQIKGALPQTFYSYTSRELRGRDWSINLSFMNPDGLELVAITNYTLKYTDAAYSIKENQDARQAKNRATQTTEIPLEVGILPAEGVESLTRILQSRMPQIIVSTVGLKYQQSLLKPSDSEDDTAPEMLFERPQLSQAYAAPTTEIEKAIAAIWEQVLGIKGIGIYDNFFDLGGDSLIIVQILQKLRQTLSSTLTINDLLNATAIAELAAIIDPNASQPSTQQPPCLVKFRDGSPDVAPLFIVHPIAGTTRNYLNLPTCLPPEQPIYAIQHPKWTAETRQFSNIPELAAYYLAAVRQVQPHGPYFLSGYSGGVYATYEMAQQLRAAGEAVSFLALIDKPHWETAADKPNWQNPDFGSDLETMVYYADLRTPKANGESHLKDYQKLNGLDEQLPYFIAHSPWIQEMMPPDSTPDEWRIFWDVFVNLRIMNVNYDLQPYDGPALYIAAEIRDIYTERFNEKPWFELIPKLQFVEVPGDHVTMWHQPQIQVLAQTIEKYAHTQNYQPQTSRPVSLSRSVELNAAQLLATAQQRAQLDNFGDATFHTGLEKLVEALNTEAALHPMGQNFIHELLVQLLVNRLEIQAELQRHPDILNTPIQQPLFIFGLPRTGSTYLHNLLCQDPEVRWLRLWEAYRPYPAPDPQTYATDPRIAQTQATFKNYEFFTPESTAMHKYDATAPEECVWLLQNHFACTSFSFLTCIPSYTAWLNAQDMRPVYGYYRQQLQLLDWRFNSNRWVLKNPFHLADLAALNATFPDAHLIQTHRDPQRVVASYCRLIKNLRPVYGNPGDVGAIAQEILDILAHQIEEGMEARHGIEAGRICDVGFNDLVRDPMGTVRRIYDHFGYRFSPEMKKNLQRYIKDNPRYKHGQYTYSLAEFDLDTERVIEKFKGYLDIFAKDIAVKNS